MPETLVRFSARDRQNVKMPHCSRRVRLCATYVSLMFVQIVSTIELSGRILAVIYPGLHFPAVLRPEIAGRILPAFLLTLIFALIAFRLRSVTAGGAIAGSIVSLAIYIGSGPAGFAALATVFLLTAVATRLGSTRKQKLGAAENKKGRRAAQVLANLAVAGALAILGGVFDLGAWIMTAMVAALAEAAADTVSSECGQAWSDRVYMITSFRRVAVGTDGGISLPGTLAGACSGALVAVVCYRTHLLPFHSAVSAGTAGVLGMLVDSILGATFERRRWFGNNVVNFLSTLAAAALAVILLP